MDVVATHAVGDGMTVQKTRISVDGRDQPR